jgi:hypothetical protein
MNTKTLWIVGGVAGVLIVLYLVFRSSQQSQAALAANSPGVGTSPSILDSLFGGGSAGIGSILSNAGGSIGSIFSGSDNFGDTGTDANDPGLGDDEEDDDYANSPGLYSYGD